MGKDLGMSPAQFPAVSVMGSVQVTLEFIQLCLKTLQGWRWHSVADWAEAPDGPSQWSESSSLLMSFLHWTVENWICPVLNSAQNPLILHLPKLNVVYFSPLTVKVPWGNGSPRVGSRDKRGLPLGMGRAGPHKPDPAPHLQEEHQASLWGWSWRWGWTRPSQARPGQAIHLWLRNRACLGSSHSQAVQGWNPAQPQLGQGLGTRDVGHSNSPGPEVSPRQRLPMVLPAGSPHSHPRNGATTGKGHSWTHWCWTGPQPCHLKTHRLGFVKKDSNFPA